MRERLIHWLGGWTTPQVHAALDKAIDNVYSKCEEDRCWMFRGHAGPHREQNGLAFSTMKAKARKERKALRGTEDAQ